MRSRSGVRITSLLLLGCALGCLALLVVDRAGFPLMHGITVSRSFFLFELATGLAIAVAVSALSRDDGASGDARVAASVALLGVCVGLPFAALLARVCAVSLASFVATSAVAFAWAGLVARVSAASSVHRSAGWLALAAIVVVPQALAWLAGTAGARVSTSVAAVSPLSLLPALERDATTPVILAWAAWLVAGGLGWISLARRGRAEANRGASASTAAAFVFAAIVFGSAERIAPEIEASSSSTAAKRSARIDLDIRPALGELGHAPGFVPFDVTIDGGAGGVSHVVVASGSGVQPKRFDVLASPGERRRTTWLLAIDRVPARVEWRVSTDDGAEPFATHDIVAPPDEGRRVALLGVTGAWREFCDRLALQLFPDADVRFVEASANAPLEAWLSARFDVAVVDLETHASRAEAMSRLGVPVLGLGSADDGVDREWLGIVERPGADVSDRLEAWREAIDDPIRRLDALLLEEAAGFGLAGSFGWDGPAVDRLLATVALLAVAQALGLVVAWRRSSRTRHAIVIATALATSVVVWFAIPVPDPVTRVEGSVVRAYLQDEGAGSMRVTNRVRLYATSETTARFESTHAATRVVGESRPPIAKVAGASREELARDAVAVAFDAELSRTESVTFESVRVVESPSVRSIEGELTDAVLVTRAGWARLGDLAIASIPRRIRERDVPSEFDRTGLAQVLGTDADPRGWPASILSRLDRFVPLLGDRALVVGIRSMTSEPDPGAAIQRFVRPEVWVVSLP